MGQEVRIREAQPLSEQQARFVAELLEHGDAEKAKAAADYSEGTPTVSILRGKLVQNAIREECDAKLKGVLRVKALKTLEDLLDTGPAATKLNAAKLILEQTEAADPMDKPLSEMTEAELVATIDRLEEAKQARAINITPKNGAHQG